MTAGEVEALFTRPDGSYRFARWDRPLAPVVFGVEDATLGVVKGAIEAVALLARHPVVETDPELGANMMIFFLRDWNELLAVPNLDRLIQDLGPMVSRLEVAGANQYRTFRFDPSGAIMASVAFLRIDDDLAAIPAETLALQVAVRAILYWSEEAFLHRPALAADPSGAVMLRPEIAGVIRAAYDPVMPASSDAAAHALRLFARLGRVGG